MEKSSSRYKGVVTWEVVQFRLQLGLTFSVEYDANVLEVDGWLI